MINHVVERLPNIGSCYKFGRDVGGLTAPEDKSEMNADFSGFKNDSVAPSTPPVAPVASTPPSPFLGPTAPKQPDAPPLLSHARSIPPRRPEINFSQTDSPHLTPPPPHFTSTVHEWSAPASRSTDRYFLFRPRHGLFSTSIYTCYYYSILYHILIYYYYSIRLSYSNLFFKF